MAPSIKSLKVIEKFRAPAALYVASETKGGGWAEVSRPGMGGEAIIQDQDDAAMRGNIVSVVRFLLRHGKDPLNARIVKGLPIVRNGTDEKSVLFVSASTSTSGIRQKTMFNFIFTTVEDADEFLMWWYAKNGSIKAWLAKEVAELTNCSFAPLQEKSKASIPKEEASKHLCESYDRKSINETGGPLALSTKLRRCSLKTSDNKNKKDSNDGSLNDGSNDGSNSNGSYDSDDGEEVEIDWNEAPQTQDWMSSFDIDA